MGCILLIMMYVISLEAILTLLIMLIGIQRTYQANGADEGINF